MPQQPEPPSTMFSGMSVNGGGGMGGGGMGGGGMGGGGFSADFSEPKPPDSPGGGDRIIYNSTASSLSQLMTALNGGGYGPAPRTVVLEMLRLAIDPTSGKRGAAWASAWASAGSPALNSYDFQQACEALEQMFATGVPPHDDKRLQT